MLMRTDPFREVDRLAQQLLGTAARPVAMPMNAYRKGPTFFVRLDLPGVEQESIDLTVEQNVLTVRASRDAVEPGEDVEVLLNECPAGTFTRQVFLGDTLDADRIEADYAGGVLTLSIPVREAAKPRRVEVTSGEGRAIES
ncbi:MAG TPA: Hsp20/alpha crystallin family protein [Gaiellaceae bacterium]|nr:Hsp20/alpha crystallin family protein [Gaiellaceae bacterium]